MRSSARLWALAAVAMHLATGAEAASYLHVASTWMDQLTFSSDVVFADSLEALSSSSCPEPGSGKIFCGELRRDIEGPLRMVGPVRVGRLCVIRAHTVVRDFVKQSYARQVDRRDPVERTFFCGLQ